MAVRIDYKRRVGRYGSNTLNRRSDTYIRRLVISGSRNRSVFKMCHAESYCQILKGIGLGSVDIQDSHWS